MEKNGDQTLNLFSQGSEKTKTWEIVSLCHPPEKVILDTFCVKLRNRVKCPVATLTPRSASPRNRKYES